MIRKRALISAVCIVLTLFLSACSLIQGDGEESKQPPSSGGSSTETSTGSTDVDPSSMTFTARDFDESYSVADSTSISFTDNKATVSGSGATAADTTVTITAEGTYIISGSCSNGRIVVDADNNKLQIVLDGLSLTSKDGPALYFKSADKVFVTLAAGSSNYIADGSAYTDTTVDNADAAIFSKADFVINGNGSLSVNGNYKHGIVSKDDLVITGGSITVTAVKTGLNGKDCVKIGGGNITVTAGKDGITSNNSENSAKGYIFITDGTIDITAENDGIQAVTLVNIVGGTISLKTGGGSVNASYSQGGFQIGWGNWGGNTQSAATVSAKGIKSTNDIIISGGTFVIDSSDDSLHSNNSVTVNGGTFDISSGDDGIHADKSLTINSGEITITKSYEGLEATDIVINGGIISLKASDDGINAAGGNDSSAMNRPGMGGFSGSTGTLTINGGYIFVDADGDGLDANGTMNVNGGITLVCGPTSSANGALDYDGDASISGGIVIALGSSGMAQNFNTATNTVSILATVSSRSAGTTVALCDESGNVIVSLTSTKTFNSCVFSSPSINVGSSYSIVVGGKIDDTDANGFAENTTVSGGTTAATVNVTSNIVGGGSGMGGGMGGKPGRH